MVLPSNPRQLSETMASIVRASSRTPLFARAPLAPHMQGAQKILQQMTFYEPVKLFDYPQKVN